MSININAAYNYCQKLASSHYENFPVARLFIPKKHRKHVAAIYAFARMADDIADEDTSAKQVAAKRRHIEQLANAINHNTYTASHNESLMLFALEDTIERYRLPRTALLRLLTAFSQDLVKANYSSHQERLAYCANSANPVGELVLHIMDQATLKTIELSNNICTTLQLINFLQDISSDFYQRQRIYLPLDDLQRFSIPANDLCNPKYQQQMQQLMIVEIDRCQQLLNIGKGILNHTHGLLYAQLITILACAQRVISKLQLRGGIISQAPKISKFDTIIILKNALTYF